MVRPVVVSVLAVAIAGCGRAELPKAPKTAVTDAVNGIVTPCGEAYMVLATGGPRADLARLDRRALPAAVRLVALERRNRGTAKIRSKPATAVPGSGSW